MSILFNLLVAELESEDFHIEQLSCKTLNELYMKTLDIVDNEKIMLVLSKKKSTEKIFKEIYDKLKISTDVDSVLFYKDRFFYFVHEKNCTKYDDNYRYVHKWLMIFLSFVGYEKETTIASVENKIMNDFKNDTCENHLSEINMKEENGKMVPNKDFQYTLYTYNILDANLTLLSANKSYNFIYYNNILFN